MFGRRTVGIEQEQQAGAPKKLVPPPVSCEEWQTRTGLGQWPLPDPGEEELWSAHSSVPALRERDSILGTLDDIKEDLEHYSPWDSAFLDGIERRLQLLEQALDSFAARFVVERAPGVAAGESSQGGLSIMPAEKAFLTELCDHDLLDSRKLPSRGSSKFKKQSSAELATQLKTVEACVFPGLRGAEAHDISLPEKLEPLHILDLITKDLSLPSHLEKAWKRFFYSSPSVSILQNTFWFVWMDQFKPDAKNQALLFNMIADNFVALLHSMTDKYKDEIFMRYPSCLAQAVHTVFSQVFPGSHKLLNTDAFLRDLCDLTSEWIAGVPSAPGSWLRWRQGGQPYRPLTRGEGEGGAEACCTSPTLTERDLLQTAAGLASHARRPVSRGRSSAFRRQRSALKPSATSTDDKSEVCVGPGAVFECVRFSISGRSPLLEHYLQTHGLAETTPPSGPLVSRTQVREIQSSQVSYGQLVRRSAADTEAAYLAYQREMARLGQEAATIHRMHIAKMNQADREDVGLLKHRHAVAILAEKLIAKRQNALPAIKTKKGSTVK